MYRNSPCEWQGSHKLLLVQEQAKSGFPMQMKGAVWAQVWTTYNCEFGRTSLAC